MLATKQNQNQAAAAAARDLKQRFLTCLHKLSDRDTHESAASELENIAKSLSSDSLPSFLSSITATDSTDKSVVRKQCLNFISLLAVHHGNALSPYISKLLSAVIRRLRDSDTSIRAACVSTAAAIATHVTKPSFSTLVKPFLEAAFTEQESNSQIGAAMCLSAVIGAAATPDLLMLRKLMGRFEKLAKCESFKAKAAVLGLIGSVIEVGGAASLSGSAVKSLVACLMEFLSSDDWAARKAAAEGLMKLALVENESLRDIKSACLKTFEAKRFDKVRLVRETMNQMVEVWKEIPYDSDEAAVSKFDSHSTIKENASDGGYPIGSKTSFPITSSAPQVKKKLFSNRSPLCNGSFVTSASKRSEKKTGPAMFRKLDLKKPSDLKVGMPDGNTRAKVEKHIEKSEEKNRLTKTHAKRTTLFINSGSRVVPCNDEISESTVVVSNGTGEIRNLKDSEDLLLIRKQLVQIENHQSHLLDLLQKFMGSSQIGMRSLETRVHGLELALDEISFDLAVSTGRMSTGASTGGMCCKLPGAEFLSSKLWRRTESRHATSSFTASSGTTAAKSIYNEVNESGDCESFKMESRRSRCKGGRGIIMNPLAKIPSECQGISGVSSNWILDSVRVAV